MRKLELTIPPVVVFLCFGLFMWGLSQLTPELLLLIDIRYSLSLSFVITGVLIAIAGVVQFRRAKTTVHPMLPAETTNIVTDGVYRYTRNPMYLGLFLVLLGWGSFLMNPVSLAVSVGFIWYMNQFQIIPEEEILESKFGHEYTEYKEQVPRWVM